MRNPAPRKNTGIFARELNPKWPRTPFWGKLNFEPEQLESNISTLFH